MSPTARAVLNLDLPGPTISRHVYGHSAEHLGHGVYGGFYVGEDKRHHPRPAPYAWTW